MKGKLSCLILYYIYVCVSFVFVLLFNLCYVLLKQKVDNSCLFHFHLAALSESLAQLLSLESTSGYFQMLPLENGIPLCFRYLFVHLFILCLFLVQQ